jgi:hypothetical protein
MKSGKIPRETMMRAIRPVQIKAIQEVIETKDKGKPVVKPEKRQIEKLDKVLRQIHKEDASSELILVYLFTKFTISGVHDYLVNKLYSLSFSKMNSIIPQLRYPNIEFADMAILVTWRSSESQTYSRR